MRTPLGTRRRSLIALGAAVLLTMTPVSTTPVLALQPDCGTACPEKK